MYGVQTKIAAGKNKNAGPAPQSKNENPDLEIGNQFAIDSDITPRIKSSSKDLTNMNYDNFRIDSKLAQITDTSIDSTKWYNSDGTHSL